jgi:hypothetical protein
VDAAIVFSVLIAVIVAFQVALSLGAPWGNLAMGGRFPGRFPIKMRIAALIQAVVLLLLAIIVLTKERLILASLYPVSAIAVWVVVAFCILALIMNLLTPSKWERVIWAPVAAILVACSTAVALQ